MIILRHYDGATSALNSLLLHHQTDYKCPEMSDCPYTGKTLLEKRELPLLPPDLGNILELADYKDGRIDRQEFFAGGHLTYSAREDT